MGKLQKRKLYLLIASLQAVMIAFLVLLASTAAPVSAAAGINSQLSFEGKIVHSDGTNITNGTYNMEFKIYQDGTNTGSGSTLKWTEDYLVAGSTGMPSTGGVTLTDGTFHVNLASICAFSGGSCGAKTNTAIDWNQDTLWLSVQVGNSSSCTVTSGVTSFNTGCAGDGEMSPFIRLTSVPYANNSALLGGLDKTGFIQNGTSTQTANFNIQSSNAGNITAVVQGAASQSVDIMQVTANGVANALLKVGNTGAAVFRNSADSATALQIQNAASGTPLFNADTLNSRIGVNVIYTAMSAPTGLVANTPTSGGSLSFTTYYYKVTALDWSGGETLVSNESFNTPAIGSPANRQIPLSWTAVPGAMGYKIYRSTTTNTEQYLTTTPLTSYTDTGTFTSAINPPSLNSAYTSATTSNSLLQLTIGGVGTPTGQVYVSGNKPKSVGYSSVQGGLTGLFVSGRYGYGVGNSSKLKVYDLSLLAGPINLSGSGATVSGSNSIISVLGRYAYVASNTPVLQVFNISNPSTPTDVSSGGVATAGNTNGIYIQGHYAYLSEANAIQIFDISNPSKPVDVTNGGISNANGPQSIYVQGRYAYVTTTNNKLYVYDVSNPALPIDVTAGGVATSVGMYKVYVQGRYAYMFGTTSFKIFDISNPAAPVEITGSISIPNSTGGGIVVQGRYAYITATNKLLVFDVSNPYYPVDVSAGGSTIQDSSALLQVQGRYAYLANSGIEVFDLGGTYTQQLEAGGAEFGTLSVDSNFQTAGDAAVAGGMTVGQGLSVGSSFNVQAGNSSLLSVDSSTSRIGVNVTYAAMSAPTSPNASTPAQNATPTVTPSGGTGSTTYNYIIIAVKATGNSAASVAGTTSTGVTTLSSTTYNALAWTAFSGATSYNIYRTSGGSTTGFIGNVSTNSFNDTGISATGSVPTVGGNLSASSTYRYKVSAIDNVGGETALSGEVNSVTGASGTLTIDFSWTAPSPGNGVAGYRVYRTAANGLTGTEKYLTTVLGTSYTDDGTISLSATTPPISTTSAYTPTNNSNSLLQLSIGGNGTPTGQLYVGGILASSLVGTLNTGTLSTTAVAVQGKYVYTAGSGAPGAIIDVSNPSSPVKVGTFSGLSGQVNDIALQGATLYAAGFSLQTYNVNSPSSTTLLSTIGVGTTDDAIDIQGRYAYTITEGSSTVATLRIFDMNNPSSPISLGATPVGNAAAGGSATKIKISGRYAYVSAWASGKFLIVDVSNPRAPTVLSTIALSTPSEITLLGKYAYILSSNNNKLYVVDVSAPSSPVLVNSLSTAIATPNAMALQGRYAYITGSTGLQIMDVSNPSSPVSVGTTTATTGTDIAINGRYAYLTSSSTLQILDLGGAYIQQLEAGGAEFGTLSVDGNSNITGTQAISGGLNVGSGIQTSGDLGVSGGVLIQGSTILTGGANTLNAPSAPSVTSQGANVDTATWTYVITAVNAYGGETTASSGGSVTATDNATLTAANNNLISWSAVSGATSYNVYRTAHGTSPSSNGFIGSTTSLSFTDSGLAGSNTAPTINTTGQLTVVGSALFKNSVNSATAFEIQSSAGTSVLKADTTSNTVTAANLVVSGTCTGCGATSLNAAYNSAATTGNAIGLTSAGAGVLIQDNSTPIGGNLLAVQKATGSVTYLGVTATGINIQSNFTGSAVNALALDTSTAIPHLKVFGANGTSFSDIYYDSSTSTAYYGASTGTSVLGSGTGPVNVTAGAGAAATITGNAASTIQTTAGVQTVQGAGGIALTSTGTNGTIVKSTTNSATSFQIQSSTSVTGLAYDTTNFHLKIYENIASPVRYADIYYDTSTGTAVFAASSGTVQLGGNTGPVTISTSGTDPVNITANGNSTWQTAAGNLTISSAAVLLLQGGTTASLLSGTSNSVTVDSGTTGNVIVGATNTTNAKTVSVGNANASSAVTLEGGTGATAIQIGNGATAHGIQIGTGAAIQTVVVGSGNSTSKTTLQGGILTTTNNNSGIVIGGGYSSSDTNLTPLTLDSTTTFTETASTCTATVNGGTLYYNSTSNAIRACVNGAWEDMVSTASLGLQLFGVVPDSGGAGAGDLSGVTGLANGPCRVSAGANLQTVAWTACVAFSGGRKVIVAAGSTGTTNTIANNFQHLCLTGANNAPALSATGAETANLATVSMPSVGSPILCLADIKFTGANNTITQIYDTRTFTTTSKTFASAITTAPVLGQVVKAGTVTPGAVTATTVVAETKTVGVIVATTGATSTTTLNAIVAINGPAAAKAITGTNTVGEFVTPSATAGYAVTSATFTSTAGYGLLGTARTAWTGATACSINANTCAGSIQVDLRIR